MAVSPRKDTSGRTIGYVAKINYHDYTGKWRQIKKNAKTQGEAKSYEADFLVQRSSNKLAGQMAPSTTAAPITVAEYLSKWLDGATDKIKKSTHNRYTELLAHVMYDGPRDENGKRPVSEIGATALANLTALQVQDLYTRLRTRGLSAKTVLNVHRVLSTALSDAVEFDVIAKTPITKKLAPRVSRYVPNPPTPEQTRKIIDAAATYAAKNDYAGSFGALIAVAAWTGARQGELLSLHWSDVDLDAGIISIRQSKTDTGRRRVPLTPATVAALREHRTRQNERRLKLGPAWQDTGFVFTSSIGTQIDPANLRRAWASICKQAGVVTRFHDLRHGFATFLLSQNVHPKIVSSLLGHSKITITLDTYSHVMPSLGLEEQAIAALDRSFAAK